MWHVQHAYVYFVSTLARGNSGSPVLPSWTWSFGDFAEVSHSGGRVAWPCRSRLHMNVVQLGTPILQLRACFQEIGAQPSQFHSLSLMCHINFNYKDPLLLLHPLLAWLWLDYGHFALHFLPTFVQLALVAILRSSMTQEMQYKENAFYMNCKIVTIFQLWMYVIINNS